MLVSLCAKMTQDHMTTLAEEVAEHLEGAWSVESFPADWGRKGAWLRGEAGEILSIGESQEYSERSKNRLSIGTDYPKEHNERGFSTTRPRISVSDTKTGKQIAADIERRLLPEYRPLLGKVLTNLSTRKAYENTLESIATKIADLVQVKRSSGDTSFSFYHSPYPIFRETLSKVEVIGKDEVELSLRLSAEDALELLQDLLAAGRKR